MKDFMFIFRGPDPAGLKFTPEQHQAATQRWMDWVGQLISKNRFGGGSPFVAQGKTVAGKKPVITDGPFAEGKELVGGYLILKAETLEEATEMAFGFPDFEVGGSVEVREILPIPM